jgi:alkanesulfonate monooxygenase SsuD/methylene tetrahydromethanopterin reductase-like flavin-dependent oxidoreductase (luciferase family)
MKASLWGQARYMGPLPHGVDWPFPPRAYDREFGRESYEATVELLELGDELGYDWISFAEHHYTGGRLTPAPAVMAAYMASRVKNARLALLGPLVPTQNPVRIAEETAMLDNLCGGRLIVGLLRGTPNEYQVAGVNPAETRARTQEGIELILKAWTEPEPFAWEGRHYRYRSVSVWPRPQQQPHPPVYALGTSMETAEFAAKHHLGLGISYEPFDFAAEQSRHYFARCAAHGWEPPADAIVFRARVYVAENREEADVFRQALESRTGREHVSRTLAYVEGIESSRRSLHHFGYSAAANFAGTPDDIIAQLQQAHDEVGIGVVDLGFDPPPGNDYRDARKLHKKLMRSVELFGREVLPAMHEIGSASPVSG